MPRRAVFLDRDGTIIHDSGYARDPAGIALLPNAVRGLRAMMETGRALVVLTNQSGVGRGLLSLDDVSRMNRALEGRLAAEGIAIAGWYVCPHAPVAGCACRKPKPGLAIRAASDLSLSMSGSFMVGDKRSDVDLAAAIGTIGIWVGGSPGRMGRPRTAADLLEAASIIRDLDAAAAAAAPDVQAVKVRAAR